MKILINDLAQSGTFTGNDSVVTTPSLMDVLTGSSGFTLSFTVSNTTAINCFGLGNTDATSVSVTFGTSIGNVFSVTNDPGLYYFTTTSSGGTNVSVTFTGGTYCGRFAIGTYRSLPIFKSREPGYKNTQMNRETLSGQVIAGLGGITKRTFSVDIKAKVNSNVLSDFESAKNYLSAQAPYFVDFTEDSAFTSITHLYAKDTSNIVFQSSMNRILYSKKFNFEECF